MMTRIISVVVASVGLFAMTACYDVQFYFICGFILLTAGCIGVIGGFNDR